MRRMIVGAMIFMVICYAGNVLPQEANLIKNGGFSFEESGGVFPAGWRLADWVEPGKASLDESFFKSVPQSLKMTNTEGNQVTIVHQRVEVEPNTDYVLTAWQRGERIEQATEKPGFARVAVEAKGRTLIDGSFRGVWRGASGTFDWTKTELAFNSAANTTLMVYMQLHGVTGTAWFDDVTLTKKVLNNDSGVLKIFPSDWQKNQYHFAEGFPHVLYFKLKGDAKAMADAQFVIDLPEGFTYVGSSPILATGLVNNERVFAADSFTQSEIERNGAKMTRVIVNVNRSIIARVAPVDKRVAWRNYNRVYIRADKGMSRKKATIFAKAIWNGGQRESKEKAITAVVLPPLEPPAIKTAKFDLYIAYLYQLTAPFEEVVDAYTGYWTSLNERPLISLPFAFHTFPEDMRKRYTDPFRIAVMIGGRFSTVLNMTQGFEERITGVLRNDGTMDKTAMCPSWIIEDKDQLFEPMLVRFITDNAIKNAPSTEAIIWNFEPTVTYDYCDVCRSNLAAANNLPAVPTIEEAKTIYAAKWFDFRVKQHAAIVAKVSDIIRRNFPGKAFWLCTDNLHTRGPILSMWCGVDARLADKYLDVHLPMPYYTGLRYFNDIVLNRSLLKKPIFPLNNPAETLIEFFERYNPQAVKQNIIATAALGCIGFGFWPDDALDGLYLTNIRDAFAVVGAAEAYYRGGTRDDASLELTPLNVTEKKIVAEGGKRITLMIPPFDTTIKHTLHKAGRNYLVTLFNYDENADAVVSLKIPSLPDEKYQVVDLESGKLYVGEANAALGAEEVRSGFLTLVRKGEVVVLEITSDAKTTKGTIAQSVFETILAEKRVAKDGGQFPEKKEGDASVTWGSITGSGAPNLVLGANGSRLFVDVAARASVIAWKTPENPAVNILTYGGLRGALGELIFFNEPKELLYPYTLRSIDVKDGMPQAVFASRAQAIGADPRVYPLTGIDVEKKLTVEANGKRLRGRFMFRNVGETKSDVDLGFRIKNIPVFSGVNADPTKGALTDVVSVSIQTPAGNEILFPKEANTLLLAPGVDKVLFTTGSDKMPSKPWLVSPIVIEAKNGGKMALSPDPVATAGIYIWWTSNLFTIEFLSTERTLAFGDSTAYEYTIEVGK